MDFKATSVALTSNASLIHDLTRVGLRRATAWVYKAAWICAHPRVSLRVARALTSPETRPILEAEARFMFKYFHAYISVDLSQAERASILAEHYTFMRNRVDGDFFRKIVDSRLELWREVVGEHTYRICLTFPQRWHNEGDLALVFEADHTDIYTLAFTVGSGEIAGRTAGHALYIARVQGKPGALDSIRRATKHCLDVSPPALLLAATEGVATALDITHMIGVGANSQLSASKECGPEGLVTVYDEFWIAAGGVRLDRNMYDLPVPASPKPIQSISSKHRRRAQRKREYRALVTQQVGLAFRNRLCTPCRGDEAKRPTLRDGRSHGSANDTEENRGFPP